jgi:hypothetical protein
MTGHFWTLCRKSTVFLQVYVYLREKTKHLPLWNMWKNGRKHWTSTKQIMRVKYLPQCGIWNFDEIDSAVCFTVLLCILPPKGMKINMQSVMLVDNKRKWMSTHTLTVGFINFVYYIFIYILYIGRKPFFISIQQKLIVTSAVMLNGPVLRSWILLSTKMWPSTFLPWAVKPPAVAMLLHFLQWYATWNMT